MMGFVAIQQFKMKIAPGFIGERLEKFPCEAETECARHILLLFKIVDGPVGEFVQTAPDQKWPSAKINYAARKAFVHGHISFPCKWIFGRSEEHTSELQ